MIAIMLGMGVDTGRSRSTAFDYAFVFGSYGDWNRYRGKRLSCIGMEMVKTNDIQAVASDFASATSLLISSTFGLPVSTTHDQNNRPAWSRHCHQSAGSQMVESSGNYLCLGTYFSGLRIIRVFYG